MRATGPAPTSCTKSCAPLTSRVVTVRHRRAPRQGPPHRSGCRRRRDRGGGARCQGCLVGGDRQPLHSVIVSAVISGMRRVDYVRVVVAGDSLTAFVGGVARRYPPSSASRSARPANWPMRVCPCASSSAAEGQDVSCLCLTRRTGRFARDERLDGLRGLARDLLDRGGHAVIPVLAMEPRHGSDVFIGVRSEAGCEHLLGPGLPGDVDVRNRSAEGAGVLFGDAVHVLRPGAGQGRRRGRCTARVEEDHGHDPPRRHRVAIGDVRPFPKGRRMVPLSAIERAARVVNNGLSKKMVGRTWTTGSPDQLRTCSDSQCSR